MITKLLLLLRAFLLANRFFWKLKQSSVHSVRELAESLAGEKQGSNAVDDIVWASYVVTTSSPWLNTCLIRSLTCYALLISEGRIATLKIGVKKPNDGILQAHAWVEDSHQKVICDKIARISEYSELLTITDN